MLNRVVPLDPGSNETPGQLLDLRFVSALETSCVFCAVERHVVFVWLLDLMFVGAFAQFSCHILAISKFLQKDAVGSLRPFFFATRCPLGHRTSSSGGLLRDRRSV